jgi:hypothetical protein
MFTIKIRKASGWLLASCLLVGGAAVASADGGDWQRTQQQQRAGETRMIEGRVVALKSVRLRGTEERNLVTMIRTAEGKQKVIDLGPRAQARQLDLEIGDRLVVRGREAQVGDQMILVANEARTSERTLSIDRSRQREHLERRMQEARGEYVCPPIEG